MRRVLDKRHYDVQLMGGIALPQCDRRDEDRRGQDLRRAARRVLLNGLVGRGVHVITVNDYLASATHSGSARSSIGSMSVGSIQHETAFIFDPDFQATDERLRDLRPVTRREAYEADVTHGTNNELGFDFLRDNLVVDLASRVQRRTSQSSTRSTISSSTRRARRSSSAARPRNRPTSTSSSPASSLGCAPRRTTSLTRSSSRSQSPRPEPTRWRAGSASRTCSPTTSASHGTSSRR